MSSQSFAVIYLHELDKYIVEKLKPILYVRYQDDGLLISDNKKDLKYYLIEIKRIVKKYKLELNHKTKIYHIDEGFEFLGFKYIRKNNRLVVKVKNQTKKRFKRKIKITYKLYIADKIKLKKVKMVESSYVGHLKYGDTNNLVSFVLRRYKKEKYYDLGNKVIIKSNGDVICIKKD